MHIAIIDDNLTDRNHFQKLISTINSSYHIDCFSSFDDFSNAKIQYTFSFVDLNINNTDAITTHAVWSNHTKWVIYITETPERMADAFDENVIGFIHKQNTDEQILSKIKNIFQRYSQKDLLIRCDNGFRKISVKHIYKITRENRKIILYTDTEEIRIYDTKLQTFIQQFPYTFIYIDKSILININHVQTITKDTITFDNQKQERISTRRVKEVCKTFIQINEETS